MMRAAACSIAFALSLAGCAQSPDGAAPSPDLARDASVPSDLTPTVDAALPVDAPTADAPAADPCDLRTEVSVRLRVPVNQHQQSTMVLHTVATIPAGTPIELLAVTDVTRGSAQRLGVLSRVRVRSTGAEGFVYVDAEAARRCQDQGATAPDIRESRTVMVDGVAETWRVRFETPSRAPADIPEGEESCPSRFEARFDRGRAVLERVRDGVVIDRYTNPCRRIDGAECGTELLIPWHVEAPAGSHLSPEASDRLPWVTFLDVGDYDHDGRATEIAVDVGHLVCGHSVSYVIGITREHPRLHALTWSDGERMVSESGRLGWEAVRANARGRAVTWGCGDHGSTAEESVRWWPSRGRLAHEEVTTQMDEACHPIPADERVIEQGE